MNERKLVSKNCKFFQRHLQFSIEHSILLLIVDNCSIIYAIHSSILFIDSTEYWLKESRTNCKVILWVVECIFIARAQEVEWVYFGLTTPPQPSNGKISLTWSNRIINKSKSQLKWPVFLFCFTISGWKPDIRSDSSKMSQIKPADKKTVEKLQRMSSSSIRSR